MMREQIREHPICAIMRNISMDLVEYYAEAAYKGGIRMFEVAMNTEGGDRQIQMLRRQFEKNADVWIGAGTVTTTERCLAAEASGAQFFLTPSASRCTLEFCKDKKIPLIPGVMTPSDVALCLEYGYDVLKLFPAASLPVNYVDSLKGPFDGTDYIAVGGVNTGNIGEFLKRGFIGVGIGSGLVPSEFVREHAWGKAENFIKNIVEQVKIHD